MPQTRQFTRSDVITPPPTISFSDWKLVDQTEDTFEYLVSFPSAYATLYPENNTVQLRVILPKAQNGPFPTVLVLHYWGARDLKVERSFGAELTKRGIAVAILSLPYHLNRTPAGKTSGEMAIQPEPEKLRETMVQSVWDVRRSIDFLQSRPELKTTPIGIAGTSLGAIVSTLGYAVDSRITHGTFLLGGIDLANIIWSSSRLAPQRDMMRRQGWSLDKLRSELAPIEPMNYLPRTAPGRTFVIRGAFDTVVPPPASQALIDRLPGTSVLAIDTGHYGGIFVQGRLFGEMANFFSKEFRGEEYSPPARILAPTLRIGLSAITEEGLNIVAGVDIWKSKNRGEQFATLLLTPRYPMIFVGQKVGQNLAAGVGITTRTAGVGLFWSLVL